MMRRGRGDKICSGCGHVPTISVLDMRLRVGMEHICPLCGAGMMTGHKPVRGVTDSQKRSRSQERRVARREGGRRQPGSGSVEGFSGDVRVARKYRGECKFTRANSFSLKLEELRKLEQQASAGELPAFDIEFLGVSPTRRYVVIPEWAFDSLMEESGRREDDDQDDS